MQRLPGPEQDAYSVTVVSENLDLLRELLNDPGVDPGCRPVIERAAEGFRTFIFATQEKIRTLERQSLFRITVGHNASQQGRERQQEIGTGDRFEQGRIVPRGYGKKV